MAFNPLAIILKEIKLVGPNYINWKRNLDIVLTTKEYKYELVEVCPQKPGERATNKETRAYQKWIKANKMARCYILASMSNVLQHQHQSMLFAYNIMQNLKEMFGYQNRAARKTIMKDLMNTIMIEGTPIRDHVLKMIGFLNELEILGAEIKGKTQVDIVLQSLSDSFKQFFLNYNMNKLSYSLAKLLKELQTTEGLIRKPTIALVTENGSFSRPKGRKKQKKGSETIGSSSNSTLP
ncbi:uncharacterized protein LOC131156097 [Malania oleifera]|uniref:uncharacterized protein LOC131156097 n=1 Tax=Malania oleifera TaxID=397392 RepID=UPI0025AE23A8|nr:uncharacterized protein LOC131156097 [Malania oleifera]